MDGEVWAPEEEEKENLLQAGAHTFPCSLLVLVGRTDQDVVTHV